MSSRDHEMMHLLKSSPVLIGLVFVAAAALHRWMLGDPGYRSHWLIRPEVALLLVLLILVFVLGLSAAVSLFAGKWGQLLVTLALLVGTVVGLAIDSPTLLYAT